MNQGLGLIGFGEAGQAFARGWALPAGRAAAFDVKIHLPLEAPTIREMCSQLHVTAADSPAAALAGCGLVFSLVPTDQTIAAAISAAPHLLPGMVWLDGSSSSPGRKREAAAIVGASGAAYIDMAVMAPVYPKLHQTPVLLAGPAATATLPHLQALGMIASIVGESVGQASAIKMIRSVLIKGLEAVTAECLLAARRAGVEEAVLTSLARSDPHVDWAARTTYNIERMTRHGTRRAAELREVVATLDELGVPSRMSAATTEWEEELGNLGLELNEETLAEQLDSVLTRLG